MKDIDSHLLNRLFSKCIEQDGVDDFTEDVFKGWLEENGINYEPEGEDERLEIFSLLISC